ncbi:hypothetical protein Dda_4246 [Drechslerella dactyloides]|uniref:Uncharacterized protein n=1 Tax=Drechslerella dactyloides TaxID=74499 RepID=A0AAD6IZV0_DREDA|nr:hypothetical protein Dda_4246 [Drechslerella dactyloides]
MGLERMSFCSLRDGPLKLGIKEEEPALILRNKDKELLRPTEPHDQDALKRKTVDITLEDMHSLVRLSTISAIDHYIQKTPSSPQSLCVPKKLPKGNVRQPQCTSRPPRDPRPMYSQEEADAILYYRDSVQLPWKKVVDAWNNLYDIHTGRRWGPRTISGLQSHYYRMLGFDKSNGRRPSAPNPEIGLLKTTDRRYWWTYGSHPSVMDTLTRATPKELKDAAKQHARRLRKEAHKGPRRQRKLVKRLTDKSDILCLDQELPATSALLEDLALPDVKVDSSNDVENLPSIDDCDQQSASDSDGFVDTDSSISSPPSSRTSLTPSPRVSLDLGPRSFTSPESPKANTTALPSFKMLDSIAGQGAYSARCAIPPVYKLDRQVSCSSVSPRNHYSNSFGVFKYSKYDTPTLAPPRPVYRNPMAFSNILSVS